jgi:hypothetical protein
MKNKWMLALLIGGLMLLLGFPLSSGVRYYQIGYPLILGGSFLVLIAIFYKIGTIPRYGEKPEKSRKTGRTWIVAMFIGGLMLLLGLPLSSGVRYYQIGYPLILGGGMLMLIAFFYRVAIEPSSR